MEIYRVTLAFTDQNGRRAYGFTMKNIEANSKEEAAEVASKRATERDAERVAKFNSECVKFGTTPQTPWDGVQVEKVRRFASDNR